MTREEWRRSWKPWLRGAAIGFPLGAVPAGGAEIPTLLSYSIERRLATRPDEFGRGAIEGVAGPEAANNASAAGTLVPLLTLGLPTSATAAVLLAAFQQYGLQPGPLLFRHEPQLVWGLIASLYIGNAMLLILNLPLVGLWVRLLMIPRRLRLRRHPHPLQPRRLQRGPFDVRRRGDVRDRRWPDSPCAIAMPLAPAVIGVILGPLAEQQFRRSLAIGGSPSIFVSRPISFTLLLLALAIVAGPRLWRRTTARRT